MKIPEIEHGHYTESEFYNWLSGGTSFLANKIIQGNLELMGFNNVEKKTIKDCSFENILEIDSRMISRLSFNGCKFKFPVSIKAGKIEDSVTFFNCEFDDTLSINSTNDGWINLNKCSISESVQFNTIVDTCIQISNTAISGNFNISSWEGDCSPKQVVLDNCTVTKHLSIDHLSKINHFSSTKGHFGSITLQGEIGECHIAGNESQKIGRLDLSNYLHSGKMVFVKVSIDHLNMSGFKGENLSLNFYDSRITEEWIMSNSSPKNLQVVNLDLSECKIIFDKSFLSGCIFSNIKWPVGKRLYSKISDDREAHSSLRETYRELKHSSTKNSNNIEALAFYRNELEEYRAFVKGNPEVKWEDKAILWMMRIFSDHGQSFLRPLIWLFGAHLVFFLIAIALNYNGFYFTLDHDWSVTFDYIGNYFYLLNPIHKLPTGQSGGMMIVDFFMRLSSGFFIYHIIRASRKFAKV